MIEKTKKVPSEEKTDKYEFDEAGHVHTLNGKPLIGVTTVLGVIAKPALIQWSANMAVDYVRDHIVENGLNIYGTDRFEEMLGEARFSSRTKKETAGEWGTTLHKAVENWIKDGDYPENLDDMAMRCFCQFMIWANKEGVKFIESEKHIWNKNLWIGGICDLVIEIKGKKYIADIKTSSGIYNEAFFQMGAYDLCFKEMGEGKDIAGYIVINLTKKGKMEMKMATDMEMNQNAFLSALSLYKIINSLKK